MDSQKGTLSMSSHNFGAISKVSDQGIKSLGGNFTCLCREFDFYEVKKVLLFFKMKSRFFSGKSSKRAE